MNIDSEIKEHILIFSGRLKNVSYSEKKTLFLEYQLKSEDFPLDFEAYCNQLIYFINNFFTDRFQLEGLLLSNYIEYKEVKEVVGDLINIYKQINQK